MNTKNEKPHIPTTEYNFYLDANYMECKLIYKPLMILLERIRILLQEYQNNPILQQIAIISYKILQFNIWTTPVIKFLTGLDLLIAKGEEWEQMAAKNINSIHSEMQIIYRLITRYRKLQIYSWPQFFKYLVYN